MTAREAIEQAGGLASQADLAQQLGVSRQRVGQLTRQPGFPAPVGTVHGGSVWLVNDVREWQRRRVERLRKRRQRGSPGAARIRP